jgi:HTH-type transcriptional repressor of NAD biosynthesis genes
MKMLRGVVAGKFVPPHLGHSHLISSARAQCGQLTVLVCDRPEYRIPARIRIGWLRQIHPDVTFIAIKDTLDDNDSAGWAANTIKVLGYRPDVVFSSEDYGPRYAKHLRCKHIAINPPRTAVPISGTQVRENPWANWQYLHPVVRAYFAKRICVVGSESTGTTTLARALAKQYDTQWVPEYGRDYTVQNFGRLEREGWNTNDFVRIARTQNTHEDALAQKANKLLICDTDSFATSIWHERYMGTRSYDTEKHAFGRRYDLYLLTDVHIPFEQDGIRDGEHFRQWMHKRIQDKLRFWGKPYVIVSGTPTERLEQSTKCIDLLMNDKTTALPGLVRDTWHPEGGF